MLVPANKSASLLTFVIRIVPPSLCKKPSPFATAVVPLEVPPSIKLISAVVAVTPSIMFNSEAVAVTPSSIFNSAAVEVIDVPPICKVVAFTSPEDPYITALEFAIVPAEEPSIKFNSAAVEDTVVPFIDKASVSKLPSTSTSPDISSEDAVSFATCKSSKLLPSFISNCGPVVLYVNVASSPEPPSIVIPAPLTTADVLLPLSNTML